MTWKFAFFTQAKDFLFYKNLCLIEVKSNPKFKKNMETTVSRLNRSK